MSAFSGAPWWVAATYLVYIVLWEGLIFGGTGYAVFWLDHSGWWFLLAIYVSASNFLPSRWRELFAPRSVGPQRST